MARWLTYLHERFPLLSYLLLSFGFAFSGALLKGTSWKWETVLISAFGILLFFAELRLMDEYKDYAKDQVAHPERPLPRQLLSLAEVRRVIHFLFLGMLGLGAWVALELNPISGALYLFFTLYLGLMYKEFFCGERLSRSPFMYAFTHQIIVIPICLFCISLGDPTFEWEGGAFAYSLGVLGAFFAYEICRKLDPQAHPLLRTYLAVYGPLKTGLAVIILLGISAVAAERIQCQSFLWPIELAVGMSLLLIFTKPSLFKVVEVFATLSLILHIWASPFHLLLRKYL